MLAKLRFLLCITRPIAIAPPCSPRSLHQLHFLQGLPRHRATDPGCLGLGFFLQLSDWQVLHTAESEGKTAILLEVVNALK